MVGLKVTLYSLLLLLFCFQYILNAVIVFWQWTSKSIRNKHSLHPTFTHGSTLGLYEILSGKPCMCNMVTDSVARCFFVESEKILSMLRSDPSVEDFLWQV